MPMLHPRCQSQKRTTATHRHLVYQALLQVFFVKKTVKSTLPTRPFKKDINFLFSF